MSGLRHAVALGMHHDRFTANHVVLLIVLFGVAILLGDDTLLPTTARVPGMLVLGVVAGWLVRGVLVPHHGRPSRELVRVSHPPRGSRPSRRP